MRKFAPTIAAIVLILGFGMAQPSIAKDYFVAISPYSSTTELEQQTKVLIGFSLERDGGDRVVFYDGYGLKRIGVFEVPTDPIYKSPKARLAANTHAVAALLRFVKSPPIAQRSKHPTIKGAVRLPQLLRVIGKASAASGHADILVIGSALYDDPNAPASSMAQEKIPGDGHIRSSRSDTPFGLKEQKDALTNARIHIVYADRGVQSKDRLQFFVERFWTLYAEAQGAKLVSFTDDLSAAIENIARGAPAPSHPHTLKQTDKLEMIKLVSAKMAQSIFDRPLSVEPLSREEFRRAERVSIAISWDCIECDLDLYARPFPDAPILFFRNTKSEEGQYWKDYKSSPQTENGYETIAFNIPLDLRALNAAVHFYSGHAEKGVNGEVRVSVNDKTYAAPFHIPATQGNIASDTDSLLDNPEYAKFERVMIDLQKIVGIQTQ